MTTKNISIIYFLAWVLLLQLVSFIIGQISIFDISTWYPNIIKSELTPPNIVFPVVWTILYFLLAILGGILFKKDNHFSAHIKSIYLVQLILNWMWSPVFFNLHAVDIALVLLIVMVILTTSLMIKLYRQHIKLSMLLIPYFIWICFATYLNAVIWYNF